MNEDRINGVRCLVCDTEVVSTHVHDYRSCACPHGTQVSVDGGPEYDRRVFGEFAHWVELRTGKECWGRESSPIPPRPEPPKTCRADACTAEVNPALIFCTRHWAKVPKAMQTAIWQTYTPGQEHITNPTHEHLDAVRSAVRIIAESEAPRLL